MPVVVHRVVSLRAWWSLESVGAAVEVEHDAAVQEPVEQGAGDDVVAAAMIDRLVHQAELIALKGDSYRLRNRDPGGRPPATTTDQD